MPDDHTSTPPESITYDFIKSNLFRVLHVDGAWGGISPDGYIQMAIFSERRAIPRRVVYQLSEGRVGPEIEREERPGLVREVEADLVMSLEAAVAIREWLDGRIEMLRELRQALSQGDDAS